MKQVEKKIQLMWRDTSSYFERKNVDAVKAIIRTRPLGTSRNAINAITRNTEEMKALMPLILGLGHGGGQDYNFTNSVNTYWNSLTVRIPFPSVTWEIGMTFDVRDTDPIRSLGIAEITKLLKPKAKGKEVKDGTEEEWVLTDDMLAEYVMGVNKDDKYNVPVEERYRYGVPIKPSEFLLWQYSLNNGNVANSKELLKNSTKMEFYLVDESTAKAERANIHKLKTEAKKLYLDTIVNPNDVTDILAVLRKQAPYDTAADEIKIVNEQLLETYMMENPKEFLDVAKSTNLKTLARIERYINVGVLRRLDNTSIVVDGDNPEIIIGQTSNEQLAFFANNSNKNILADYQAKYKSLLNK